MSSHNPASIGQGGIAEYSERLAPARARMRSSAFATRVLSPDLRAEDLELFLIHYCSLGVAMTRPVEGWIRRAGEACVRRGWTALGEALLRHARHEADHHEMMIRDTEALVGARRERGLSVSAAATAADLIGRPPMSGALAYIALHEDTIAGPAPYAQLAIEYEIERLSVVFGPTLIERCQACFGPEVRSQISFLDDHVRLDVGHTRFNERQLELALDDHPDWLAPLVDAGTRALHAYAAFLDDCIEAAGLGVKHGGAG